MCVTYHGESDVGLLESGSVVGSVPGDGDHLAVLRDARLDDPLDERVLVLRRRPRQHP